MNYGGGESLLIKLNRDKIVIVSSIYKYVWLKKWYVEFAIEMFLIMLFCAGYAIYNSWLFIVSEQILALEQHLSHAVHCHVEDGADVSSGIHTAVRSDVLGKLLDGHHIGVLRDGECILLLGLHWWPAPAIILDQLRSSIMTAFWHDRLFLRLLVQRYEEFLYLPNFCLW